jgi:hypothetical protein
MYTIIYSFYKFIIITLKIYNYKYFQNSIMLHNNYVQKHL